MDLKFKESTLEYGLEYISVEDQDLDTTSEVEELKVEVNHYYMSLFQMDTILKRSSFADIFCVLSGLLFCFKYFRARSYSSLAFPSVCRSPCILLMLFFRVHLVFSLQFLLRLCQSLNFVCPEKSDKFKRPSSSSEVERRISRLINSQGYQA